MLDLNMEGLNSSLAILNESCGLSAPPEPRLGKVGKSMPQPKMRFVSCCFVTPMVCWHRGCCAFGNCAELQDAAWCFMQALVQMQS